MSRKTERTQRDSRPPAFPAVNTVTAMLQKALDLIHLDFAPEHQQPSGGRVALATVVSLAGSLLADALLVVIAQASFASTKGYSHFQSAASGKLTFIGVIIACVAWPVTYNALVRLAPVRAPSRSAGRRVQPAGR